MLKKLFFLLISLPGYLYAAPAYDSVSGRTMNIAGHLNSIANGTCFVIGIGLLGGALSQYIQHRRNRLQTPISRPIFMLILGLIIILIPILGSLTQGGTIANDA